MRLPQSITPPAARLLLQTAKAIMTVGGRVPMGTTETETLDIIREELCDQPLTPAEIANTVPHDLEHTFAAQDESFGDFAIMLWTALSMLDRKRSADKVKIVRSVAHRVGCPQPTHDDLLAICLNNKAIWPRVRIFQRVYRDMFHTSFGAGNTSILLSYLGISGAASRRRYRRLSSLSPDTLGGQLYQFYHQNKTPMPGEPKSFPESLMGAHDVRHVLTGFDTSYKGEIGVSLFEVGACDQPMLDFLVLIILQYHLGIQMDPTVPPAKGLFEPRELFEQIRRGNAVNEDMFKRGWNFWRYVDTPLNEIRAQLNITPGGNVDAEMRWRGDNAVIFNELSRN